jgi:hypothetical protein
MVTWVSTLDISIALIGYSVLPVLIRGLLLDLRELRCVELLSIIAVNCVVPEIYAMFPYHAQSSI